MTPFYQKFTYFHFPPFFIWLFLALTVLLAAALWARITLRLRLTYPFADKPKLPFSRADLPFALELAKFLLSQMRLKQLHCQIALSGRPDLTALAGGALSAALHGVAAAAGCRNVDVRLNFTTAELEPAREVSAQVSLKISLPVWVLLTAVFRLAAYLWQRRRKLKAATD